MHANPVSACPVHLSNGGDAVRRCGTQVDSNGNASPLSTVSPSATADPLAGWIHALSPTTGTGWVAPSLLLPPPLSSRRLRLALSHFLLSRYRHVCVCVDAVLSCTTHPPCKSISLSRPESHSEVCASALHLKVPIRLQERQRGDWLRPRCDQHRHGCLEIQPALAPADPRRVPLAGRRCGGRRWCAVLDGGHPRTAHCTHHTTLHCTALPVHCIHTAAHSHEAPHATVVQSACPSLIQSLQWTSVVCSKLAT